MMSASFCDFPELALTAAWQRRASSLLLRYAETAVYVLFPSFGGLLKLVLFSHRRALDFFLDLLGF